MNSTIRVNSVKATVVNLAFNKTELTRHPSVSDTNNKQQNIRHKPITKPVLVAVSVLKQIKKIKVLMVLIILKNLLNTHHKQIIQLVLVVVLE